MHEEVFSFFWRTLSRTNIIKMVFIYIISKGIHCIFHMCYYQTWSFWILFICLSQRSLATSSFDVIPRSSKIWEITFILKKWLSANLCLAAIELVMYCKPVFWLAALAFMVCSRAMSMDVLLKDLPVVLNENTPFQNSSYVVVWLSWSFNKLSWNLTAQRA